jgi:hypothetical protein
MLTAHAGAAKDARPLSQFRALRALEGRRAHSLTRPRDAEPRGLLSTRSARLASGRLGASSFSDLRDAAQLGPSSFIDLRDTAQLGPSSFIDLRDTAQLGPSSFIDLRDAAQLGPSSFIDLRDTAQLGPSSFIDLRDTAQLGPSRFIHLRDTPQLGAASFIDLLGTAQLAPSTEVGPSLHDATRGREGSGEGSRNSRSRPRAVTHRESVERAPHPYDAIRGPSMAELAVGRLSASGLVKKANSRLLTL